MIRSHVDCTTNLNQLLLQAWLLVLVAKLTIVLVFMQNVTLGTANLHLTFTKVDRKFETLSEYSKCSSRFLLKVSCCSQRNIIRKIVRHFAG